MTPEDIFLNVGIQIHLRLWQPAAQRGKKKRSFVLLHGLSSNAQTWDLVASRLALAGHQVAAIDQRGHGISEKPDQGYGFSTFTNDLYQILQQLGWEQPVLVGQSWGGNVLLDFAAQFPGTAQGYVFVDGGFLNLQERGPWEQSAIELRPPDLSGIHRSQIADRIRQMHPGWAEQGIEATLGNFEILPDQTVRPWLTIERHMMILKSMFEQDLSAQFPRVQEPVLICAADDGSDRMPFKQKQVQAAELALKQVWVRWFPDCAHDIHIDQPAQLADAIMENPFQGKN